MYKIYIKRKKKNFFPIYIFYMKSTALNTTISGSQSRLFKNIYLFFIIIKFLIHIKLEYNRHW